MKKILFTLVSFLIIPAILISILNIDFESEEVVYESYAADILAKPECEIDESITYTYDIVEEIENPYDDTDTVEVLTNLLYGEARGVKSKAERAAVVWVVLNRFDNGNYGNTIIEVATAKNQFLGYKRDRIFRDTNAYNDCKELVEDVLDRYYLEKIGVEDVGRTIPSNYLYFYSPKGQNNINKFTSKWKDYSTLWDWSLPNPYID